MDGRRPCVYMLVSKRNGTLYIGVTSNLIRRIWQHKNEATEGFSKRHRVHLLVWYELHQAMDSAILREKTLKGWRRAWKKRSIEGENPDWRDLYPALTQQHAE